MKIIQIKIDLHFLNRYDDFIKAEKEIETEGSVIRELLSGEKKCRMSVDSHSGAGYPNAVG